jgi:hypothetical protein
MLKVIVWIKTRFINWSFINFHILDNLSDFFVLPGTTSGGTINDIHETTTKSPLGRYV